MDARRFFITVIILVEDDFNDVSRSSFIQVKSAQAVSSSVAAFGSAECTKTSARILFDCPLRRGVMCTKYEYSVSIFEKITDAIFYFVLNNTSPDVTPSPLDC